MVNGLSSLTGHQIFERRPPSHDRRLCDELASLLVDATRIRLRADVPVGAYLSGGLDSSTTTAIIRNYTHNRLDTFSIAFADNPEFDESKFQKQMAAHLGTDHRVVECTHAEIGSVFPDVTWHTEAPILRTAPAPCSFYPSLFTTTGFKVVLTGEGADEFLAGYDIFKEMKIRRFWAKNPDSQIRPLLLKRLYPDITDLGMVNNAYLTAFFRPESERHPITVLLSRNPMGEYRSHSPVLFAQAPALSIDKLVSLPAAFGTWPCLHKLSI